MSPSRTHRALERRGCSAGGMSETTVQAMIRDSLDHCVKCTICETFCPVAAATPLFPGPKYVGPQAERYRSPDGPSPDSSLDYCSSCGICTQVCPQGVKIAEINSQARALMKADRGVPLRDRLIARPTLTGPPGHAGRRRSPTGPCATGSCAGSRSGPSASTARRPMPRWAGRTLQAWARRTGRRRPPEPGALNSVVFFHGCGANYYEPDTGRRAVEVLEHNGLDVIIPRQGCCGLPLQSNGLFPDARRYVRKLAARARALRAGRARHRRHLHELRPDAQARGRGDPGHRGRGPRGRARAPLRHLRVPRADARARRAADRLPGSSTWRCPTTRPASSAATASARRPST